jgi:hypothetical protein
MNNKTSVEILKQYKWDYDKDHIYNKQKEQ